MIMNCEEKEKAPTQWQSGLWRGSAAVRLLGLRVRIPPEDWTSVSYGLQVLSGKGLHTDRSQVQRDLTECGKASQGRSWPTRGRRDIRGWAGNKRNRTRCCSTISLLDLYRRVFSTCNTRYNVHKQKSSDITQYVH